MVALVTVADLSPMQLYGIVFAALVGFWLVQFAIRGVNEMTGSRERLFGYLGLSLMIGLPTLIGLMAMRP